jgi:hypothetical protein
LSSFFSHSSIRRLQVLYLHSGDQCCSKASLDDMIFEFRKVTLAGVLLSPEIGKFIVDNSPKLEHFIYEGFWSEGSHCSSRRQLFEKVMSYRYFGSHSLPQIELELKNDYNLFLHSPDSLSTEIEMLSAGFPKLEKGHLEVNESRPILILDAFASCKNKTTS